MQEQDYMFCTLKKCYFPFLLAVTQGDQYHSQFNGRFAAGLFLPGVLLSSNLE